MNQRELLLRELPAGTKLAPAKFKSNGTVSYTLTYRGQKEAALVPDEVQNDLELKFHILSDRTLFLEWMYVERRPEYTGLGKRLLANLVAFAQANHIRKIDLEASGYKKRPDNDGSLFFARAGFWPNTNQWQTLYPSLHDALRIYDDLLPSDKRAQLGNTLRPSNPKSLYHFVIRDIPGIALPAAKEAMLQVKWQGSLDLHSPEQMRLLEQFLGPQYSQQISLTQSRKHPHAHLNA